MKRGMIRKRGANEKRNRGIVREMRIARWHRKNEIARASRKRNRK